LTLIAYEPIIETLSLPHDYVLDVLRLDLLHPEISGNKWFKLKYNLEKAISGNFDTVVTFGGAFSNHIAATAAACKLYALRSVAVIRGEGSGTLNSTLSKAKADGMQLHFVSRDEYAQKNSVAFKNYLNAQFGAHYFIPEGGNNEAGVLGCKDILRSEWEYDYVFCACGTATTFSGLVAAAKPTETVIGISVLKGENKLPAESEALLTTLEPLRQFKIFGKEAFTDLQAGKHCITNAYCFSGYAKCDKALTDFKQSFENLHAIPLDHIYTNKLFYAVFDLMRKQQLQKGARLLVIHSGGLQGNRGFEARYHLAPGLQ
jgi:1-aminocyclopropane-1-carboxylate deaminase